MYISATALCAKGVTGFLLYFPTVALRLLLKAYISPPYFGQKAHLGSASALPRLSKIIVFARCPC